MHCVHSMSILFGPSFGNPFSQSKALFFCLWNGYWWITHYHLVYFLSRLNTPLPVWNLESDIKLDADNSTTGWKKTSNIKGQRMDICNYKSQRNTPIKISLIWFYSLSHKVKDWDAYGHFLFIFGKFSGCVHCLEKKKIIVRKQYDK